MRLQSAIFEMFALLWEAISIQATSLTSAGHEKVELAHLIRGRLQGLVNQHFEQGIVAEQHYGIDDVAAGLGMSTSHCNRVFRHVFGLPPRAFLSELMLQKAKVLLLDDRLPVQQISSILGYRDIAHFSRQFKRWSGQSPSEYRRGVLARA